ncbi:MAG: 30S ribosomal protein S17 [Candidatus Micrarchaeota archaeon]
MENMEEKCDDKNCFKHAGLKIRGRRTKGIVVSDKGKRTAIVERNISNIMPKYNRISKERSRIVVHNPSCINAKIGDVVEIGETKKMSKTKAWIIMSIIK